MYLEKGQKMEGIKVRERVKGQNEKKQKNIIFLFDCQITALSMTASRVDLLSQNNLLHNLLQQAGIQLEQSYA